MKFQYLNLTAPLLKAVEEMGFSTPTTIQEKAFPVIMSGRDVCGVAQTGTGKTLAYLLPTLRMLEFAKHRFAQMLILVPTRELVTQVVQMAKKLCEHKNFTVVGVFGGVNMKPQAAAIINGLDILVATPGRLYDLILNGAFSPKYVKKFVVDEVDEMLDLGFRMQLRNIMDLLPEKRQNLLFSATLTPDVDNLMDVYFNAPVRIEAAPMGSPLENIEQSYYQLPNFYTKVNLLKLLLQQDDSMSKVLVFTATKKMADQLHQEVTEDFSETVGVIHSNKDQNQRFNTVNRFKDGTYRFIIATDIVARGIDIAGVSHVINFDLPDMPEHYIHRIGRTGRADQRGVAISFIAPSEKDFQRQIEDLMQYAIPQKDLPTDLEISDVLTDDEQPKVFHKEIATKLLKQIPEGGPAFHEKKAKNMKTNKKVSHQDKMMKKYGKPKTRGAKTKKKR